MHDIYYTIEKQEAVEQDYLVITLPQSGLTLPQWRAKGLKQQDKDLITLLVKEESAYQLRLTKRTPHVETMPIHRLRISTAQTLTLLEKLAETQQLFFNEKQLVVDFYMPVQFYYKGTQGNNQTLHLTGRIKWRETDIALTDCEVIGPGKNPWFVRGIALKKIATPISWKELKNLYSEQLLILEGAQKLAFLEEIEEDHEGPQLILEDVNLSDVKQGASPLPFLVLKDRFGAFADLWMDYGQGLKTLIQNPLLEIKDQKNQLQIKRQLQIEKNWEKDLLETNFTLKNSGTSHYYCPTHQVAKSLLFLLEIGWSLQDWKGNQIIRQGTTQLHLQEKNQIIAIQGTVKFEEYEADLSQVLGAFNRRETFVQLSENRVGLLATDQDSENLQQLAEECEIVGTSVQMKKNQLGSLSHLFEQAEFSSSLKTLRDNIHNFQAIEEALPSSSFKGQLRTYQQIGVNWLAFLHAYHLHGILADDMGLGKTVQILAFLSQLPKNLPHLIVMPTSLLFNWRQEIEKFLPDMTCVVHQGLKRSRCLEELQSFSIILTSYGTMRSDAILLNQLNYHCLILDEAQVIKNASTMTAQNLYDFKAQMRLCITGTPIENHMNELWSQFRFLMPDLLGNLETFQSETQTGQSDRRYLERIKRKISPFILRRTKQEVLKDLPERIDQLISIEMDETQRQLYEKFLSGYRKNLIKKVEVDGVNKHRMEILEAILRLRQICCHPLLVSSLNDADEVTTSSKFEALTQDLETVVSEKSKVLIYSQFTGMLKLMTKLADSKQWPYCYLDGTTQEREKVVEKFQNTEGPLLFFISLKAGGVGLNLTAADYVMLYDPWWNEAVEEQAINRAHRIGRKEIVIAKRYIISDSIEEKIMKLKAAKKQMIEQVFEENDASSLTVENLTYLFS